MIIVWPTHLRACTRRRWRKRGVWSACAWRAACRRRPWWERGWSTCWSGRTRPAPGTPGTNLIKRGEQRMKNLFVCLFVCWGLTSLLNIWGYIATVHACSTVELWPMCCHTEMSCRRHRTWHPTPSQYTDTRPTSHCAIHWCVMLKPHQYRIKKNVWLTHIWFI